VIEPREIQTLHDRPSEELRELMAHCAGICAHRDGDGGALIATALERIAYRLRYQPRKTA
jgi:hypothetical protein